MTLFKGTHRTDETGRDWFRFNGYISFDGNYPDDFQPVEPVILGSDNSDVYMDFTKFGYVRQSVAYDSDGTLVNANVPVYEYESFSVTTGPVVIAFQPWTSSHVPQLQINQGIHISPLVNEQNFEPFQVNRGKTFLRQIERLPHYYNNNHQSNNAKLISLISDEIEEVYMSLDKALEWQLDIDRAHGKGLDMHGRNIQQYRGSDLDVDYRLWLLAKQIAILSRSELASHNQALRFILRDALLRVYESWANAFRLNQATGGVTLTGSTRLDGIFWHTEPQEPGTVVVEYEQSPFFRQIRESYRDLGTAEEYLELMLITINRVREMMQLVKAGGVGVYWVAYVPDEGITDPATSDATAIVKDNPAAVTNLALGNAGHDANGDPIEPTGAEVAVYGEHSQVPLLGQYIQVTASNQLLITAYVGRDELVGETISSAGIYDASDDLVIVQNFHPFVKDDKTRLIFQWTLPGIFFNGMYLFNGEIDFEGAA